MPNPETFKRLLAEMAEQEMLADEEVRAVEEKLKELEVRIDECNARLELVAKDRQAIMAMMQRYSSDGHKEAGARETEALLSAGRAKSKEARQKSSRTEPSPVDDRRAPPRKPEKSEPEELHAGQLEAEIETVADKEPGASKSTGIEEDTKDIEEALKNLFSEDSSP